MVDLLSFGVEKLWDLLSNEYKHFKGVKDQVTELKTDLDTLKSFLKNADAKKHTSAMVKNCLEVIKEIICDAEDIIETFILKDELGKIGGIKKRIRRLACIIPERKETTLEIRGISKRISNVIRDMKNFGVRQITVDVRDSQPLQERLEFARKYESNLVGLDENVKKLVEYLVAEDNVQVISVTGMGGLGKTTLARQAFNHMMVENKFDRLAWVCVSQVFNRKNVWQTILQSFRPKEEENEIRQMTEARLQDELFRLLKTSKSLIIFDDIWKEEHWGQIRDIFPSEKGWKVLLTSRNANVLGHGEPSINFKPECLSIQDSWTLFQIIAMPRQDASEWKVDEEMEKMGKQMIKHCGGLPLAIKVLGGLLAEKYTFHEWKRVLENIGSRILGGRTSSNDDNNNLLDRVLSLSFEELPSYLKLCFLYLAHFPEDYAIPVKKLSYCWAAEGIFEPRHFDGETIQDVGDKYIEGLVRRNMVISERDNTTSRFETCRLHDMMREICLSKAKEENFLQIDNILSPTANAQSRRFVWQYPTTLDVEREINNPNLRSLLIVTGSYYINRWTLSGSSFRRLELLRVLDLFNARLDEGKLTSSIGKLINLRYLSLKYVAVSHLPSSLGNLKLLIYLNLTVSWTSYSEIIFVPNVLKGMKELRYLALPRDMDEKAKLDLSNQVNLEILKNFSTRNVRLDDLHGMGRLRTLKITLIGETSMETLFSSISGQRHLEDLFIKDYGFHRKIEKRLRHFPSHLKTISLEGCHLAEDPMPILEKLLQLKKVYLGYESFCGRRMVCSSSGFPQLQKLVLRELWELEEWVVEEGSMPLLHTLTIERCYELRKLPDGLRFIYSLMDLTMEKEWKERLSEGGEDYYKVQHIPYVTFPGR